jgi:sugar phosphate isomerase/epimerase
MILTMHGLTTMHCNIVTDIRLARETGHDGLEIGAEKLLRYLDSGLRAEDLTAIFARYDIRPICINALTHIEQIEDMERKELMAAAERLSAVAEIISCPTIQLVSLCGFEGRPLEEVLELTALNLAEIADIGKRHGVRFQLEPVAWAPIHSLSHALTLIERADRDNVGIVVDFWHLWAGGETSPAEVARLDPSIIYEVHFCDGKRIPKDRLWTEGALRGYLPGDGDIPIRAWTAAVKKTGFDGSWAVELFSPQHWEWDLNEVTSESKRRILEYLAGSVRDTWLSDFKN